MVFKQPWTFLYIQTICLLFRLPLFNSVYSDAWSTLGKRKRNTESDSYKSNDKHLKLLNDDSNNQHLHINAVTIL